jgi:hypothetical protein
MYGAFYVMNTLKPIPTVTTENPYSSSIRPEWACAVMPGRQNRLISAVSG